MSGERSRGIGANLVDYSRQPIPLEQIFDASPSSSNNKLWSATLESGLRIVLQLGTGLI